MPGLLDSLDSLFSGSGISGQISVQVEGLNDITAAVQALTSGPDTLTNLQNAIGNLPVPAGLEGIGNLSSSLGSLQVPTDLSGALAPILGPITGLNIQVTGSAGAAIAALEQCGCLTHQERALLEENYRFLRKIEHRLQIMFDLQTHEMPDEPAELRKVETR